MKKGLLLLGLLVAPLGANAALLKIDYSGEVYQSTGYSGYQIGELVSGSIYIDAGIAPADQAQDSAARGVYSAEDNTDFVFGYTEGTAFDMVNIEDDFIGTRDAIGVTDFGGHYDEFTGNGNYNTREFSVSLFASDSDLNFITGDGLLQSFSLFDADVFRGEYSLSNINRSPGLETFIGGIARFNLTHLSAAVTDRDVRIPTPPALPLLASGLIGLGLFRRFRRPNAGG